MTRSLLIPFAASLAFQHVLWGMATPSPDPLTIAPSRHWSRPRRKPITTRKAPPPWCQHPASIRLENDFIQHSWPDPVVSPIPASAHRTRPDAIRRSITDRSQPSASSASNVKPAQGPEPASPRSTLDACTQAHPPAIAIGALSPPPSSIVSSTGFPPLRTQAGA